MFQKQEENIASCPFNPNHTFTKQRLIFHLNKCKDRIKLQHLFATCTYNSLHFIPKQDIETHQLICPERAEVRALANQLRRSYQLARRQRERSRERLKREQQLIVDKKNEGDQQEQEQGEEDEVILESCEHCQRLLMQLSQEIKGNPKLIKYLIKYEAIRKSATR